MAYRYDLFISYPRSFQRGDVRVETAASAWVKSVFYRRLVGAVGVAPNWCVDFPLVQVDAADTPRDIYSPGLGR